MKCPVCGSRNTLDEDYGFDLDGTVERQWNCDDCESVFWQQGTMDEEGWTVETWERTAFRVEPSEQGEKILAEKQEAAIMAMARAKTMPMF